MCACRMACRLNCLRASRSATCRQLALHQVPFGCAERVIVGYCKAANGRIRCALLVLHAIHCRWGRGEPESRCRCGQNEPIPGANVAPLSPVPVQRWEGRAQSQCRCGRVGSTPGSNDHVWIGRRRHGSQRPEAESTEAEGRGGQASPGADVARSCADVAESTEAEGRGGRQVPVRVLRAVRLRAACRVSHDAVSAV